MAISDPARNLKPKDTVLERAGRLLGGRLEFDPNVSEASVRPRMSIFRGRQRWTRQFTALCAIRRSDTHLLRTRPRRDDIASTSPALAGEVEAEDFSRVSSQSTRAEDEKAVLVVDDEPTVRIPVTEVLHDLSCMAIEAADGAAGVKVLQSDPRVDLLITGVGLSSGMNRRQMADMARELRPGVNVLFTTGYAENAVIGNGHLDQGMHVMTKPLAMEALASRIKNLISPGRGDLIMTATDHRSMHPP
jgi:CheY-like chemotaxis protein